MAKVSSGTVRMEQGGEQEASGRGSFHCVPHCSACPSRPVTPGTEVGVWKPHAHLRTAHSWAGGAPEVQRWVTPKFLQVGSVRDSFPPIRLWEAGRTPLQPPSSSRPLPTPPHLPWGGKGSGLTTSAHLTRRQYQSQNPRRLEHLFWLELWFRHWSLLCGTESK